LSPTTCPRPLVFHPAHPSPAPHPSPTRRSPDLPPFPAGCWHITWVPSHWSSVQGLPSEVHAVPLVFFSSAGHAPPAVPGQFSARSDSPTAAPQPQLKPGTPPPLEAAPAPVHPSS